MIQSDKTLRLAYWLQKNGEHRCHIEASERLLDQRHANAVLLQWVLETNKRYDEMKKQLEEMKVKEQ